MGRVLKFADPKTGLTPAQERFAFAIARGLTQADAYRESHRVNGLSTNAIDIRASRLAGQAKVRERVRGILAEAKVADLEAVGEAFAALKADLEAARTAKNWTAVAQFQRIKLQMQGLLKETVVLLPEQRLTDEEVVNRVAGKNPALAAALKASLGKEDTFAS